MPILATYADVYRQPQSRTFRPGLGVLPLASDKAILLGSSIETDAYFGGAGGDDIFCYLSTAGSVADVLLRRGPGRAFFRAVDELASIHSVTAWKAGWFGVKKAFRGPRVLPAQTQCLTPMAWDQPHVHHPWLAAPASTLPGKFEHVMSLVGAQSRGEGKDRMARAPLRLPLLSQPVVEACLRIPSWMWTKGGRDRSVARDAFSEWLPYEVATRRTKGDFGTFNWEIYEMNRVAIRELLLDGYLRQAGLIDVLAIETHLNRREANGSPDYSRLVRLATVEAWVRNWRDVSPSGDDSGIEK